MMPVAALGGAVFEGPVTVRELAPRTMLALRGDLSDRGLSESAAAVAGVAFPGLGEAQVEGERGLFWMSPDELLIMVPREEQGSVAAALEKRLAGSHHLLADVSDMRSIFRVDGAPEAGGTDVRETLAKLSPADLHPDSLLPGRLRRTRLAQVPAAFWLDEAGVAHVIAFRSVSEYVFGLLKTAASTGKTGAF